MKKIYLILLAVLGFSIAASAQNGTTSESSKDYARRIANAAESRYGTCVTSDGKQGTLQVSSKTVTTSQSNTSSNTRNSGSQSVNGGFEVSTSKISISAGGQVNSGTTSGTKSNTGTTTTITNYQCVEKKQY